MAAALPLLPRSLLLLPFDENAGAPAKAEKPLLCTGAAAAAETAAGAAAPSRLVAAALARRSCSAISNSSGAAFSCASSPYLCCQAQPKTDAHGEAFLAEPESAAVAPNTMHTLLFMLCTYDKARQECFKFWLALQGGHCMCT